MPDERPAEVTKVPVTEVEATIHPASLRDVLTQRIAVDVHENIRQQAIVITEDRARLCLISHKDRMSGKTDWVTPFSLLTTIVLTKLTATFNDFVLKAAVWEAMFMMGGIVSVIWLLTTLPRAFLHWPGLVNQVRDDFEQVLEHPRPNALKDRSSSLGDACPRGIS